MSTTIEWTEETFNPIRARNLETGGLGHYCSRVSPGCEQCYAARLQPRYRNPIDYSAQDRAKVEVFLDEKVLARPLKWRTPRRIFPCSMTDLFGEFVKDEWLDRIFAVMTQTERHTYQVLTKRPARMRRYVEDWMRRTQGPLTPNVWLGTSIEDQRRADERLPELLQTPVAVRWVSFEPLLGDVNLAARGVNLLELGTLHWGVVGGESGPSARTTNLRHIWSLVDQFQHAEVPVFVKQVGRRPVHRGGQPLELVHDRSKGGDPRDWPEDLRVRQYPVGVTP